MSSEIELLAARSRGRKAKGEGHQRRAEILAAAQRIFVTEGYAGTTIRKIAEAVGVSSTALYMHFPDKAAILVEICQIIIRRVFDSNRAISALDLDPLIKTRQMMEAYMAFAMEQPFAYQLVFGESSHWLSDLDRSRNMKMSDDNYSVFLSAVQEMCAAYPMREKDPDVVAQLIWAAGHGLVALMIAMPDFDWHDRCRQQRAMLDAIFSGLMEPL